jgi:hypothetical protein
MASNPQAFTASDILEAIRLRVVEATEVDTHFVRLVANDNYRYSEEEDLIAIRPLGPTPYTDAGGGRYSRPVSRIIRIYIHKRSSLDYVGSDSQVVGLLCDREDEVFDWLDDWFPTNADDEVMTIEPLHPVDSSAGPPTRQDLNDIGETFSRIDFEVRYLLSNDQDVPESEA